MVLLDTIVNSFPHFSHIARHLHELTRKNVEFKWTDKHTTAVNSLKDAITSPDCLTIFDSSRQTILTTDACDYALGAVLTQKHDHGERPVAFISCALNATERNYSMWEKELFAIVWSIKYFCPYLLNHEFLVKSDNKPSTQLLVNSALKLSTSATNRVIRWILSIQAYNFKVEHQAGKTNVVADALSRFAAHINAIPDDLATAEFCQLQTSPQPHTKLFDSFQNAYKTDTRFAPLYQQLSDGQYHPRLALHHDLIVTRETPFRVLVPDNSTLRAELFREIHETPLTGHPGFHKFYSYVQRHFAGNHLKRDVLEFTRSCPQCQIAQNLAITFHLEPSCHFSLLKNLGKMSPWISLFTSRNHRHLMLSLSLLIVSPKWHTLSLLKHRSTHLNWHNSSSTTLFAYMVFLVALSLIVILAFFPISGMNSSL